MAVVNFTPFRASVILGSGNVGPATMCPSINFTGHILEGDYTFWLETREDLSSLTGCSVSPRPMSSSFPEDTGKDQIGTAFYSRDDESAEGTKAAVQFIAFLPDERFWESLSWIQRGHLPRVLSIHLTGNYWVGPEPKWDNVSRNPLPISGIAYEFVVPEQRRGDAS